MYKKMIAGFGGAIALNILHEVIRKNFDDVPHINELGEEALLKVTDQTPFSISSDKIYTATLAGDIMSNGIYYATTATQNNMASGLLAGIGAVALPKYMGLDDEPVASTNKKKLMTVGYYVFGALVTKFIYDRIK
ncbi:hypothetical protein ASG01_03160 [Chryseobacterium sp. Leaf180]|jgi:hypothetical protein|uniref:hypothetical protein n=1 Tax=Chryseobacterium sp. Leaf180 TaxID=1736289 RepID=UPI0006F288A4|nr:hypothetical protein [Chryseobacterium sp. Leaf180]KQR94878.1 hypothetical protein ASG01_03160 [Chryseobacterium sp. Leaf180]